MACKNIAKSAQTAAKNGLVELRKRVPPNQINQFLRFRDQNSKYKSQVDKYPQVLPLIDWDFYRANVRAEYVKLVNDFEKKYEELNKVFDARSSLDTKKYYEELEKQRAEVQTEVNKYIAASNERIKALEAEIARIKNLKDYNNMTMEELLCMRPECATFIPFGCKPLFWPHFPEDQKPGAVGMARTKDEEESGIDDGGDDGDNGGGMKGAAPANENPPSKSPPPLAATAATQPKDSKSATTENAAKAAASDTTSAATAAAASAVEPKSTEAAETSKSAAQTDPCKIMKEEKSKAPAQMDPCSFMEVSQKLDSSADGKKRLDPCGIIERNMQRAVGKPMDQTATESKAADTEHKPCMPARVPCRGEQVSSAGGKTACSNAAKNEPQTACKQETKIDRSQIGKDPCGLDKKEDPCKAEKDAKSSCQTEKKDACKKENDPCAAKAGDACNAAEPCKTPQADPCKTERQDPCDKKKT